MPISWHWGAQSTKCGNRGENWGASTCLDASSGDILPVNKFRIGSQSRPIDDPIVPIHLAARHLLTVSCAGKALHVTLDYALHATTLYSPTRLVVDAKHHQPFNRLKCSSILRSQPGFRDREQFVNKCINLRTYPASTRTEVEADHRSAQPSKAHPGSSKRHPRT